MTTSSEEPLPRADEADVAEQSQEVDGGGPVGPGPDVSSDDADLADALEQRADLASDDDDEYPRE